MELLASLAIAIVGSLLLHAAFSWVARSRKGWK